MVNPKNTQQPVYPIPTRPTKSPTSGFGNPKLLLTLKIVPPVHFCTDQVVLLVNVGVGVGVDVLVGVGVGVFDVVGVGVGHATMN